MDLVVRRAAVFLAINFCRYSISIALTVKLAIGLSYCMGMRSCNQYCSRRHPAAIIGNGHERAKEGDRFSRRRELVSPGVMKYFELFFNAFSLLYW